MSILHDPVFWDLRPFLWITVGSHYQPIIGVKLPADLDLRRRFLAVTMPCVCCGTRINPIRPDFGQLLYWPTCSMVACMISIDAREDLIAMQHAILHARDAAGTTPDDPRLPFDGDR